jgi:hypothetical protein
MARTLYQFANAKTRTKPRKNQGALTAFPVSRHPRAYPPTARDVNMPKNLGSAKEIALATTDLAKPIKRNGKQKGGRLKEQENGLTPEEEAWINLITTTNLSDVQAYMKLKGCSNRVASTGVWRMKKRPQVQAAIVAIARKTVAFSSLSAARRLEKLANEAKSEYVQADAAKSILDRAGIATQAQPGGISSGALSITINIGRYEDPQPIVIDHVSNSDLSE